MRPSLLATRATGVVMQDGYDLPDQAKVFRAPFWTIVRDLRGKVAAVGVAEHERLRSTLVRRVERAEGVLLASCRSRRRSAPHRRSLLALRSAGRRRSPRSSKDSPPTWYEGSPRPEDCEDLPTIQHTSVPAAHQAPAHSGSSWGFELGAARGTERHDLRM